jgi:hypothetical protein
MLIIVNANANKAKGKEGTQHKTLPVGISGF